MHINNYIYIYIYLYAMFVVHTRCFGAALGGGRWGGGPGLRPGLAEVCAGGGL